MRRLSGGKFILGKTPLFRSLKSVIRKARPEFSADRRTFIKTLSFSAAALTIPSPFLNHEQFDRDQNLSTVIIGGGLAGLGAAAEFRDAKIPFQLYEAGGRMGGRVLSQRNCNSDGQTTELGAELIDSVHTTLIGWCKRLGLELQAFEREDDTRNGEVFFVGGQYYTADELAAKVEPLLAHIRNSVAELRQGIPMSVYLGHWFANNPRVVKYDRMSLAEFLDGLSDVEVWVKEIVRIAYEAEFGLEAGEQTVVNLFELIDTSMEQGFSLFGISDEGFRIRGGNDQLIRGLFEYGFPGGLNDSQVNLDHKLVRIRDLNPKIELTFMHGLTSKTVLADRVVCTLPFSVLREVEGIEALALHPVKKRSIMELGYGTNAKVIVGFKDRFWKTGQFRPANGAAIFTDLQSQSFWETSRMQNGNRGMLTSFRSGINGATVDVSAIEPTIKDLETIFAAQTLQDRVDRDQQGRPRAFVANWTQNSLIRGSYFCFRPGQITRCWGDNDTPDLNGRIAFAGEHTSMTSPGFMNGALESGQRAARQLKVRRSLF